MLVVGFAATALLGGAQRAYAGIALNTIDRQVTYDRDGARVRSTGPIACTRGERVTVGVGVRQAATRARARGRWEGRCTGEVQRWQVPANVGGEARFSRGSGRVCAVARTRAGGRVTDTRRWCRRVSVSPASRGLRPGRQPLPAPGSIGGRAAAGADGLIVEVHPNPAEALCDGPQALATADLPAIWLEDGVESANTKP